MFAGVYWDPGTIRINQGHRSGLMLGWDPMFAKVYLEDGVI